MVLCSTGRLLEEVSLPGGLAADSRGRGVGQVAVLGAALGSASLRASIHTGCGEDWGSLPADTFFFFGLIVQRMRS